MSGELPTAPSIDDGQVILEESPDAELNAVAQKLEIPLDQINYVSPQILIEGKIVGNNGDYCLQRYLGHGGQGMVFLAENSEVGPCAVKIQNTADQFTASTFGQERRLIIELNHKVETTTYKYPKSARPLRLIDSCVCHGHDCMVFELLDQEQNLSQKPEKMELEESDLVAILLQMLTFLQIMHLEAGNIYKDQKRENYWWDKEQKQLVVSDLGLFQSYTLDDAKTDFLRALRYVPHFISGGGEQTATNEQDFLTSESFHELSESFQKLYIDILSTTRSGKMDTGMGTELLQKLASVVERWEKTIPDLLGEATQAIEAVEQLALADHTPHHLHRSKWAQAADLLDILEKKATRINDKQIQAKCTRLRDRLFAVAPDYLLRELTSLSKVKMSVAQDSRDFQKRTLSDTSDYQLVQQFCNQEDVVTCVEQHQWNQLHDRCESAKPAYLLGLFSMVVDKNLIHSLPAWALQIYQLSTGKSQFVLLMQLVSELLPLAVEVVEKRLTNEADVLEKLKKIKTLIEKLEGQGDYRLKLLFELAHPSISDTGALSDRIAVLETKVKKSVAPVSEVIAETGVVRGKQQVLNRTLLQVHQSYLHADSNLAVIPAEEYSNIFTEIGGLKDIVAQKLDRISDYSYEPKNLGVILTYCTSGSEDAAITTYSDFFQLPLSTHVWAAWSHDFHLLETPFSTSDIVDLYKGYAQLQTSSGSATTGSIAQIKERTKARKAVIDESRNLQLLVKLVSNYRQLPAPVSLEAQRAEIAQFDLVIKTFLKLPSWLQDFLVVTDSELRSLLARRRQVSGSVASEINYLMGSNATDLEPLYTQLESEKRLLEESLTYVQENEPSAALLVRIYTAATTYFHRKLVRSSISVLVRDGNESSVEDDIHGICDSLLRDQRPAYRVLRNDGSFFPDSQSPGSLTEWTREQVVIEVVRLLLEQSKSTPKTSITDGDISRLLEIVDHSLDGETELSKLFSLPQLRLFVERFMQRADFLQTYLTERDGVDTKLIEELPEPIRPLDISQTLGDVLDDPDLFLSYATQAPNWLASHVAELGDADEVGQFIDMTLRDEVFRNRLQAILTDYSNPLYQGGINLLRKIRGRLSELINDPNDREEAMVMLEEVEEEWG